MAKVLIVGASNKSTRSIARSLLKKGCEIFVLNDVDLAVSKSKFIKEFILKPNLNENIQVFKDEVILAITKFKIEVVIPSTDIAVDVISHFKSEIEKYAPVIGLNLPEVYKYAHNKYELMKAGKEVGLNIPSYIYVDDLNNLPNLNDFSFQSVVKPISSAKISGNKHLGYKVAFPESKIQLSDVLRELVPSTPVMVQEYIEGYGIGYNLYAINGEIKSEYIHKRLKENEGVSSYRKIIPIDSYGLKEKVHALIKKIGWNGVGMVEFRIDNDGVPYLMEMNGRFFGSTEVGVKAGYDFPKFLFTHQFLKSPEIVNNTGKFYSLRLLHDEVLLETHKLLTTKNILAFLSWFFSLFNLVLPKNYLEDNYFEDPKFVKSLYSYDSIRIKSKKQRKKEIEAIVIKPVLKAHWDKCKNIAFVCKGNICRSPFAEMYAKKINANKTFISVGTINLIDRFSPVNALKAANILEVDLSSHQSKHLNDIDKSAIECFIVMDKLNYTELIEYNIPESKLFFLSNHQIADPYKKGISEFGEVYTEIKKCLDKLN